MAFNAVKLDISMRESLGFDLLLESASSCH